MGFTTYTTYLERMTGERVKNITSGAVRDDRNTDQTTTMVDAFSSENAEESTGGKPNFIGRIVQSNPDDPENGPKDEWKEEGSDYYDYLYEIEVLDKDWKNLHQYSLEVSNNFNSKWMLFIGHLENIHGTLADNGIEDYDDLAEALEGKVYEFREITFDEDEEFTWEESPDQHTVNLGEMFDGGENAPNEFIVPVRAVSEDELEDLDVDEGEEEVEEVEL